jgi:hypothetical protein
MPQPASVLHFTDYIPARGLQTQRSVLAQQRGGNLSSNVAMRSAGPVHCHVNNSQLLLIIQSQMDPDHRETVYLLTEDSFLAHYP